MDPTIWKTVATMLVTAIITWSATFLAIGSGKADVEDVAVNTSSIRSMERTMSTFQIETARTLGRIEAKLDGLKEADGR